MYCRNCGAQLPDDSAYCTVCGTPAGKSSEDNEDKTPDNGKPQKRSRKNREINPPPLIMRILLTFCAVMLICLTVCTLLVNFIGKEAEATILDTTVYGKVHNEKYLYTWDVTYEFYAGGKRYVDTDQLTGPEGSINTFGYHVLYLPFAPEVSRLSRSPSAAELTDLTDIIHTGASSVFCCILYLTVSYVLLWVAFPKLPFFGRHKKKKK